MSYLKVALRFLLSHVMCTEIMIPNGTENHWAYYLDEFVNFQLRKYLENFLNVSNLSMCKKDQIYKEAIVF